MRQQNVLITGISSGIGRSAAVFLAEHGFCVYGTVRKQEDADEIKALNNPNLIPLLMDVTDKAQINTIKDQLKDIPLAGLVNNAGIAVSGPVKYVSEDKLRRLFDVNVFGLINVTQAFIPNLELNGKINGTPGRIVNISSVSGLIVTPFMSPYAASKFAVEAFSDGMRRELNHTGIKVCIIEPGPIKTKIWDKAMTEDTSDFKNEYSKMAQHRSGFIQNTIDNALPDVYTSRSIYDALTDSNPKIRKIVTKNATMFKLIRKLPARWLDYFAGKRINMNQIEKNLKNH